VAEAQEALTALINENNAPFGDVSAAELAAASARLRAAKQVLQQVTAINAAAAAAAADGSG
jgi:hypothetical protein